MRKIQLSKLFLAAAWLSVSALATAQSDDTGSQQTSINLAPDSLIHPEQFGVDEFGLSSAQAVLASMPESEPSFVPGSAADEATKSSSLPSQIVNGTFDNGRVGWIGRITGDGTPQVPNQVGPSIWGYSGINPPVARPIGLGNQATAGGIPKCATFGYMYQDVSILPGTWLTFNWDESVSNPSGLAGTLGVSIRDPITDRELWPAFRPNSTSVVGGKYSQIDLTEFAGQDVRIRFQTRSKPVGGFFPDCNDLTWVDNVTLGQRPIQYSTARPSAGAWYNPLRSGSGWDLRRAPDGTYYGIWYTFQGGTPIWYYLDQVSVVNGVFRTNIRRFDRVGTSSQQTVVGRAELRMMSADRGMMSFDFFDIPNTQGIWDRTENYKILLRAGGAHSGHWNNNVSSDPNWGFGTLHESEDRLFALHYFYTSGGAPTWSRSQGGFTGMGSLPVVKTIGGLCPTCPGYTPDVSYEDVGSFFLDFPATPNGTVMSAFAAGSWNRPLRTYYKLSN